MQCRETQDRMPGMDEAVGLDVEDGDGRKLFAMNEFENTFKKIKFLISAKGKKKIFL